jgi:hypothetical protein
MAKKSRTSSGWKPRRPQNEGSGEGVKRDKAGGARGAHGQGGGPAAGKSGWIARIPFLGGLFGRTSGR